MLLLLSLGAFRPIEPKGGSYLANIWNLYGQEVLAMGENTIPFGFDIFVHTAISPSS